MSGKGNLYPELFKSRYPVLSGKAWIKTVESDDRKAFVELGQKHSEYGRLGGVARSKSAKRDEKGRYVKNKTASS